MRASKLLPAFLLALGAAITGDALATLEPGRPAPDFTQTGSEAWLNSKPLTWADLRGKVVVLDFWTFACWNCYRSIPWLNTLRAKYGQDLVVVGVHTPELAHEYDLDRLKAKLGEYAVTDPQMIDNDHAYWNAMRNRAWPAFYLVDRRGQVRARHIGETHENDRSAKAIEADIRELLAEPTERRTP